MTRKTKEITLYRSVDFVYGNCVSRALIKAFNINDKIFNAICYAAGIQKPNQGLTYFECKRIINVLCKAYKQKATYYPNYGLVTYGQLAFVLPKSKYIVIFDEHISYLEDDQIFDGWFDKEQIMKRKPTGWWEIKY